MMTFKFEKDEKIPKKILESIWSQLNEIKDGVSRPSNHDISKISKVGILGSGLMGHGIAYVSALAGIDVIMTDVSQDIANNGLDRINKILKQGLSHKILDQERVNHILNRINPTNDYSKLNGCDIIIEAVFEDRQLKGKVTKISEHYLNSDGIFASNTSSIPISRLAKQSINPEKFIGIHFFSPVHKMKLVEIIKGDKTSQETLAKAFDYVLQIEKIPIVVNDSRGFYTSRVFERYTSEGMALIAEGNPAQNIESAGKKAGYPVGPLAVVDEINIGLAASIRDQMWIELKAEGKELPIGPWDKVIDFMVDSVKRTGRARGGGFYEYPKNGKKYLWPDLEKHFPISKKPLPEKEMIERFYFIQAIETIRCYEENILRSVAEANIGSILGWGFPAFKGGTLQFVSDYGINNFKTRAKDLSNIYGERFSPPRLLDEMIEKGDVF